ncbi:MAG: FtsX-like permease family protein, partial [Planctomycetota bacterium]
WSVRGLTKRSPRSLLAGSSENSFAVHGHHRPRPATMTALVAFAAAITFVTLSSFTEVLPKSVAFFLAGAAMLTTCLAVLARRLRAQPRGIIHKPGPLAVVRLGLRNAPRHLGRSMLTAGLIASATFVIISLEAFRLDTDADSLDRRSGTGGFALYAESAVPLPYDLHTAEGREALNVTDPALDLANGVTVVPFRLRPGDESSCLNLYQATKPQILGVSEAMIQRGGFRFAASLALTDGERDNPWILLNRTFPDGAVAVIGDEAAVKWQLHLDLGKDLVLEDERGRETHLRFVAMLKGSALQSELLVAESQFVRLFPSLTGQAFFLIDAPLERMTNVETALERELERFSFDAAPTSRRLNEFLAVQNTYISTFQTLGGIGLLLGTAGLATVILRNIWERRGELALMRTLGFSRPAIASLVLSENAALLLSGLLSGGLAALVAIAPAIAVDPMAVPWRSLATTLIAVFSAGILAGALALIPAMRTPVLSALRAE